MAFRAAKTTADQLEEVRDRYFRTKTVIQSHSDSSGLTVYAQGGPGEIKPGTIHVGYFPCEYCRRVPVTRTKTCVGCGAPSK